MKTIVKKIQERDFRNSVKELAESIVNESIAKYDLDDVIEWKLSGGTTFRMYKDTHEFLFSDKLLDLNEAKILHEFLMKYAK